MFFFGELVDHYLENHQPADLASKPLLLAHLPTTTFNHPDGYGSPLMGSQLLGGGRCLVTRRNQGTAGPPLNYLDDPPSIVLNLHEFLGDIGDYPTWWERDQKKTNKDQKNK
jgi:hypothetical protein